MPFLTADVTDERDALAVFAQQQVHQVATTLQGLDRSGLEERPTVSAFSLGTLARHVLAVATGFAAEIRSASGTANRGAADGSAPVDALTGDDSGELLPTDTAESLAEELDAAGAALAEALRRGDLEAPVPVPEAPWFSGQERWTVRWVGMHCVEEIARHAGHADLLRESLDGEYAYSLNARADGEPWPPANW